MPYFHLFEIDFVSYCYICTIQNNNFISVVRRSVHEGTKEFSTKCPECGKTFNDKGYLSSHLKIHRDRKEYECPHCPKRFNQRVAYNMHLRIHTGIVTVYSDLNLCFFHSPNGCILSHSIIFLGHIN